MSSAPGGDVDLPTADDCSETTLQQDSDRDDDSLNTAVETLDDGHSVSKQPRSSSSSLSLTQQAEKPKTRVYPWSCRRLALSPPAAVPSRVVQAPTYSSPPLFPRYGHTLLPTPAHNGELYLFGGLVEDVLQNDLYVISTQNLSATLVHTTGEVPSPRVGHASTLIRSVLMIWGGDTEPNGGARRSNKHDDGLYLLNTGER